MAYESRLSTMGANESVVNKRTMIDSVSEAATPKYEKRNELLFAGSCVVSCHHRPICIAFSRSISTLTAIVLLKKQLERAGVVHEGTNIPDADHGCSVFLLFRAPVIRDRSSTSERSRSMSGCSSPCCCQRVFYRQCCMQ
jgi:hypothetical protein